MTSDDTAFLIDLVRDLAASYSRAYGNRRDPNWRDADVWWVLEAQPERWQRFQQIASGREPSEHPRR